VDSLYQDTPGYEWTSLYPLLLDLSRTTPMEADKDQPVFFLFSLPNSDTPLLLTGVRSTDPERTKLYLYAMEGEKLYQLIILHEVPVYCASGHFLILREEKAEYVYTPHILLRTELLELPDDMSEIALVDLTNFTITSEAIPDYIVDLTGEEAEQ